MNIVTEPRVYLVGRQSIDEAGIDAFLESNGVGKWSTDTDVAAELLTETAGRVCYMSFAKPRPGGNSAYLGHILDVGHGSVLEHGVYNLIIEGVSRSFTHELVRHRAGFGYSQLSQRYVDESDTAFVVPPALADEIRWAREWLESEGLSPYQWLMAWNNDEVCTPDDDAIVCGLKWLAANDVALAMYSSVSSYMMVKLGDQIKDNTARRKSARESARSVLPNATETKIFVTANCRALRHFIEMRASAAADAEIRRVAVAVLRIMQREAPNVFGDYRILPCPLGGEMAETDHPKV